MIHLTRLFWPSDSKPEWPGAHCAARDCDGKHALFEEAVLREMRAIETVHIVAPSGGQDVDLMQTVQSFGRGIMSFLATGGAIDFYNVLAGELRRHPELARTFYEAGPETIANSSAILAGAGDRLAIDDPVKAAEALFGLWQGAGNFQLSLGVDTEASDAAIAERVDYGIAIFMRAFERGDRWIPTERFEQVEMATLTVCQQAKQN